MLVVYNIIGFLIIFLLIMDNAYWIIKMVVDS